jgi:hypothetical protein
MAASQFLPHYVVYIFMIVCSSVPVLADTITLNTPLSVTGSTVTYNKYMCLMTNEASQSIPNDTSTEVKFSTPVVNGNGWFNVSGSSFTPTIAGCWRITILAGYGSLSSGKYAVFDVYKNGTAEKRLCQSSPGGNYDLVCGGETLVYLDGDCTAPVNFGQFLGRF